MPISGIELIIMCPEHRRSNRCDHSGTVIEKKIAFLEDKEERITDMKFLNNLAAENLLRTFDCVIQL